ncbi:uncharacterized protein LOC143058027 [Mytilus galloprovincialis]|uniref:uncharacterized protein LOC143058027 n=1 Tax=Mytilus galloprovincialis TaxID=29158 RepID=UPI003F7B9016
MLKMLASILLLSACFLAASANCKFQCYRFDVGTWINENRAFIWSCANPTVLTILSVNGVEERVCYARRGPFLVSRIGNTYRCIKDVAYNTKVGVALIYITPAKIYLKEPSICEVCSGRYIPRVSVAKGLNHERARQTISAPLGCNRPAFCPIKDWYNDKPCSPGLINDDGLVCKSCIRY